MLERTTKLWSPTHFWLENKQPKVWTLFSFKPLLLHYVFGALKRLFNPRPLPATQPSTVQETSTEESRQAGQLLGWMGFCQLEKKLAVFCTLPVLRLSECESVNRWEYLTPPFLVSSSYHAYINMLKLKPSSCTNPPRERRGNPVKLVRFYKFNSGRELSIDIFRLNRLAMGYDHKTRLTQYTS